MKKTALILIMYLSSPLTCIAKNYIISIGIDKVPYFGPEKDLNFAVNAAKDMKDYFASDLGYEFLYFPNSSSHEVYSSLKKLRSQLKPKDQLLLFFSGHGYKVVNESQVKKHLIFTNTSEKDLDNSSITVSQLHSFFNTLGHIKKKAMIISACFCGDVDPNILNAKGISGQTDNANYYVIYTAKDNEFAYESLSIQSDVYIHYFLEAVRSGFALTMGRAHAYASLRTIKATNGMQTPSINSLIEGAETFLVGKPKTSIQLASNQNSYLTLLDLTPKSIYIDGRKVDDNLDLIKGGNKRIEVYDESGDLYLSKLVYLRSGREYFLDKLIQENPENEITIELKNLFLSDTKSTATPLFCDFHHAGAGVKYKYLKSELKYFFGFSSLLPAHETRSILDRDTNVKKFLLTLESGVEKEETLPLDIPFTLYSSYQGGISLAYLRNNWDKEYFGSDQFGLFPGLSFGVGMGIKPGDFDICIGANMSIYSDFKGNNVKSTSYDLRIGFYQW